MDTTKNKFISARLSESTHMLLLQRATKLGKHPSLIIEDYVERGLEEDIKGDGKPSIELQIYAATRRSSMRNTINSMLKHLAYECIQSADQEKYDELKGFCETAHIPVDTIMRSVQGLTSAPLIIQDDGHGISSAKTWLEKTIEKGKEYPSRTVEKMAEEMGFSKNVLKAAKQELGIASLRRSRHWVWLWTEDVAKAIVVEVLEGGRNE